MRYVHTYEQRPLVRELEALRNSREASRFAMQLILCNVLFMHGVENLSQSNVQTNICERFANVRELFANARDMFAKFHKIFLQSTVCI